MDALALWGFRTDDPITGVDFRTVPPRSSADVRLRVKNQSDQYTALGVVVDLVADPDPATQFLLSLDGRAFAASVDLGDLVAAALSEVIWLRRVTPSDAATGAFQCRLRVAATAWTHPT